MDTSKLASDQPNLISKRVAHKKMKKGMGVALACLQATSAAGSPDAETRRSVSVMEGRGTGMHKAARVAAAPRPWESTASFPRGTCCAAVALLSGFCCRRARSIHHPLPWWSRSPASLLCSHLYRPELSKSPASISTGSGLQTELLQKLNPSTRRHRAAVQGRRPRARVRAWELAVKLSVTAPPVMRLVVSYGTS